MTDFDAARQDDSPGRSFELRVGRGSWLGCYSGLALHRNFALAQLFPATLVLLLQVGVRKGHTCPQASMFPAGFMYGTRHFFVEFVEFVVFGVAAGEGQLT